MTDDRKRDRDALTRSWKEWATRDPARFGDKALAAATKIGQNILGKLRRDEYPPSPERARVIYEHMPLPELRPWVGRSLPESTEPPEAPEPTEESSAPAQSPETRDEAAFYLGGEARELLRATRVVRLAPPQDVALTDLEFDVISTPNFQRLRGIRQLGTAYLVYPSAHHTRFEHSIGTLHEASRMIAAVEEDRGWSERQRTIPDSDKVFIRLTALLHDITHIPFGHTLEDETAVIRPGHDHDPDRLEALLRGPIELAITRKLRAEGFRFLVKLLTAKTDQRVAKLGRQAYISDIVGNTVCADLLDYLRRDIYFCGLDEASGSRFMRYLTIGDATPGVGSSPWRLIVRLTKNVDEPPRRDVISELVQLLRVRYTLGERVYYHHAKMSSSAMVARAVWSAMHDDVEERLDLEKLRELGDDLLLDWLSTCGHEVAQHLARSLRVRRLWKQVFSLQRDDAPPHWVRTLTARYLETPADNEAQEAESQAAVRVQAEDELASFAGLNHGEVLIYCPPANMALKAAKVLVEWNEQVLALREVPESALDLGLRSLLDSHRKLWGLHVFARPEVPAVQMNRLRRMCEAKFSARASNRDWGLREERRVINEAVIEAHRELSGPRVDMDTVADVTSSLVADHVDAGRAIPSWREIQEAVGLASQESGGVP